MKYQLKSLGNQVNEMIRRDYKFLTSDLEIFVRELKSRIKASPSEFLEPGSDTPAIDIRLCVGPDYWRFRSGLVDYDPSHDPICGASQVTLETKTEPLLESLIDQVMDQAYGV